MIDAGIIALALAATTIAKVLTDMLRKALPQMASWISPVAALAFAISSSFLLLEATGLEITRQLGAQAILAGVLAAGGAVGVTELQKHSSK